MAGMNTDQPIRLLHLSDIHFNEDTHWEVDPALRALAQFVGDEVKGGLAPDLVVFTGGLAHSGKAEEYTLAQRWLKQALWPVLTSTRNRLPQNRLLLVPGNHDVARKAVRFIEKATQAALLQGADQGQIADVLSDPSQRESLLKRHAGYLDFYGNWLGKPQALPWWQQTFTIHNQRVHVAGLDSAWMAYRDKERGALLLGRWQINQTVLAREAADADWRIALLHHPWNY